ncbi:MAG TPA: hypothetical protein VGM03_05495 [Phycisphaerae bacterium]|jgi:hypothetical protein
MMSETPPELPSAATSAAAAAPRSLSELPLDELRRYGQDLGLDLAVDLPQGETLRLVRQRQELMLELERDALLDVVVWLREPVRKSESKEALVRRITRCTRVRFEGLSERGLHAVARLRGIEPLPDEPRADLERRLHRAETLWQKVRRKRREVMGGMIDKLLSPPDGEAAGEYHFLPEDPAARSLRTQIEDEGVVGGIARRLRGVADDYVREKLDEIEVRIDRKLDEIDRRLGEWRDREVSNRLRIIKITLVVTILVALLSLSYDWAKSRVGSADAGPGGSSGAVLRPSERTAPD